MTLTVSATPGSTLAVPGELRFAPSKVYFGADVLLPETALVAGESVRIPVQLMPNFTGIAKQQFCGFGECFDVDDGSQQIHFEKEWFDTKFSPMHCQDFKADGFATGFFGDGSRVFFPAGTEMLWHVSTLRANSSDNAFLFDCP